HQGLMKHLEQGTMILGPVPSPITRVKNRYRYQLILKYRYHPHLQRIIANEIDQFQKEMRQGLQIIVDFNPYQIMLKGRYIFHVLFLLLYLHYLFPFLSIYYYLII